MAKIDASNWIVAEQLLADEGATAGSTGAAVAVEELPERVMGVLHVLSVGADADETLDVVIEGREDDGEAWEEVAAFAQATQPDGAQVLKADLSAIHREYRAVSTIAGTTPAFSYVVEVVGDELARVGTAAR